MSTMQRITAWWKARRERQEQLAKVREEANQVVRSARLEKLELIREVRSRQWKS